MNFDVVGAFQLPRIDGVVDPSAKDKREFWTAVDDEVEGLSEACGCYIFAAQNKPWYVGLAERQDFKRECLTDHKLRYYNRVLRQYERAVPYLYFIAKLTPNGSFAHPSGNGHADVVALENILIGLAIGRNSKVVNLRGTKLLRNMNVPGILNTRKGQGKSDSVREVRRLFGV